MLDEKSIWRVGDFLTRGAEEHGVLQVDEASLDRHCSPPDGEGRRWRPQERSCLFC
jgi:hypothetical protein